MSRTTAQWQAADAAHFLHPFTDFAALARKGARIISRAEGIYLWDSEGRRILDAMSGLWCVNVGYGQRALIDAATRQLGELPFYNAFFQTATPPAIELAELLAELTPPQFQHVFFTGSGSEGNDTVVRMVRRYWDLLGQPDRQVIISRRNAYHGSTMAGASLGGMGAMHAQGGLPIPGIVHIEQPHWFELGLVAHVHDDVGPYLASAFAQLAAHPLVGEAQTCGLMGALQLVRDKSCGLAFPGEWEVGMACRGHCFDSGLIMRAVGDRMIVAPPLVIGRAQIDEMVGLIGHCLDLTLAGLRSQGRL
jgi:adenosylmethionine-8-amino-7-oxononanoate aminotransferase